MKARSKNANECQVYYRMDGMSQPKWKDEKSQMKIKSNDKL
jgi:hypothetical protein